MDIDSVLGELGGSDGSARQLPILEELSRLDRRAFEMAQLVLRDPLLRAQLKQEAVRLTRQLDGLARKLESAHPDLCHEVADQVSESFLDLSFVELESDVVSLRLGEFLR